MASQLHTGLQFNYNVNGLHTALRWCCLNVWNGIVSAFNEQGVRWYSCMFEFEYVIILYAMHYDTIAIASELQWQWNTVLRWCWLWLNLWDGVTLPLDEQQVRWYWCISEFECVITWYTMDYYDTIAIIANSPAIKIQWWWHTYGCALMSIESI